MKQPKKFALILKVYLFDDTFSRSQSRPFFEVELEKPEQLSLLYEAVSNAKDYVLFGQVIFLKKYFHHAQVVEEEVKK